MLIRYIVVVASLSFLMACNSKNLHTVVSNVFNPEVLAQQSFTIDPTQDTTITLASGLSFKIPANAIKTPNGQTATIKIREALELEDMLRAGLTTQTDGEPMSSAGMFEFMIEDEGAEVVGKIKVELPSDRLDPQMSLYEGERDANGQLNWKNPKPLAVDAPPSGQDLFAELCSSCHSIDKEDGWDKGDAIPLSHPYKRYDKNWLVNFTRGSVMDEIANCSCDRWGGAFSESSNDPAQGHKDESITEQFMPPQTDEIGQYTPDDTLASMDCYHRNKTGALSNTQILSIYDYIQKESETKKLPVPKFNAMACELACQELNTQIDKNIELFAKVQELTTQALADQAAAKKALEKYKAVKVTIIRPDSSTFSNFIVLDSVPPQYERTPVEGRIASRYQFEITAQGWYNVDIILYKANFTKSKLFIEVKGVDADKVDVFLVVPSIKVFAQAGIDQVSGKYTITKGGDISLPQNKLAWIYCLGEEDGRFYLAQQAFSTSTDQKIAVSPKKSSKDAIEKALRLMSKDLSMETDKLTKKERKEIKKLQENLQVSETQLENLAEEFELLTNTLKALYQQANKPESCACACKVKAYPLEN